MLTGLSLPMIALLAVAGVALDWLFGEVSRWHPLVGFGRYANAVEHYLNGGQHRFWCGLLAWMLTVLPWVALAYWLTSIDSIGLALHIGLLYFCIGLRSLHDHNLPISQALAQNNLTQARLLTGRIVSRETQHADASELAKASTESLLENGNDAVFGTLFWFVVAGGTGAVLFRLANTLDAMWGYRTERFLAFGCAAARIDDGLNWLSARFTALSYIALGKTLEDKRRAWHCWRTQAPAWSSPNAGPVMASGAGALGIALGGAACYNGVIEQRPPLGLGRPPCAADINRAWQLVAATSKLWLGILVVIALALWMARASYA